MRRPDGPGSSADTAFTQIRNSGTGALADTGAESMPVVVASDHTGLMIINYGPGRKTISEANSQEMISQSSKKARRAADSRSVTKHTVVKSAASSILFKAPPAVACVKKLKGRQCCVQCFTFSTPQWREGPQGARTLCNACGVRYRKQLNQAKKLKGK